MPKTHVSKSVVISASTSEIFPKISDFKQWPAWSPWLVLEPGAKLDFSEDGQSYTWKGETIGEGRIQKVEEVEGESLQCQLNILRPWRSVSEVTFRLEQIGDGTEVTWTMDGKLPWFLSMMKPIMETLVGMDYDRGCTMLKEFCETGEFLSEITQVGEEDYPGCSFVGLTTQCKISDIGSCMQKDFEKLDPWVCAQGEEAPQAPFSVYEKWDMGKGTCRYTVGFPVESLPDELPEGFVTGTLPAGKVFVIQHRGPYRHLGNAWSLGMLLSRGKKFKQRKGCFPFEVYVNPPRETPENDLLVKICFPVV